MRLTRPAGLVLAGSMLFSGTRPPSFAADPPAKEGKKPSKAVLDEKTKDVTDRALAWLADKQNADGSYGDSRYPQNTAITGFVLMAFMSQGHLPNQGKYGPEVSKGSRFILASQRDDGYLLGRGGGNMYCHGMATLALTQLFGMTGDEAVKKALKRAVDLIVRSQNDEGGWRYDPSPSGADISVTIMQVMALRGAKDSGMHVPDKTLKNALEYINNCYDAQSGGYTYQPRNRQPGFARTAAGVCVVKLTGEYEKNVDKSVEFMKKQLGEQFEHYWYGHYYACHAMHQVGGKSWEDYYAHIKAKMPEMQAKDGSFSKHHTTNEVGPVYSTAIAVIALSVPMNYLPIFQR